MSDAWEAWWYGASGYDRRTRSHLEDLAASQSRARSQLAAQLRKQSGDLQTQIDRLTRALVALVEYEDIREELTDYADAASVRRYAREAVAGVVMTGGAGLASVPVPPDVHGYWLAPAARGLAAAAQGDTAEGERLLAEAERRDPHRTAWFLTLVDAITRRPDRSARHLPRLLPTGPELTVAQRALWVAVCQDRLGDGARGLLVSGLRTALAATSGDAVADWLAAHTPSSALTTSDPQSAAVGLARLAELATGQRPPDDLVVDTPEDPLADCLRSLVDQPAPGEAEIRARMDAARSTLGVVEATTADPSAWDAPAGTVAELLLDDLSTAGDGRRQVALELLAPSMRTLAGTLAARAEAPTVTTTEVVVAGQTVTVGTTGPVDDSWVAAVEGRAAGYHPDRPWHRPATYVALGVAALCAMLAVLTSAGRSSWVLVAVLGLAAATTLFVLDRRDDRDRAEAVRRARRDAERRLASATDELHASVAARDAAAARVPALRAAIEGALEARADGATARPGPVPSPMS